MLWDDALRMQTRSTLTALSPDFLIPQVVKAQGLQNQFSGTSFPGQLHYVGVVGTQQKDSNIYCLWEELVAGSRSGRRGLPPVNVWI